MAPEIGVFTALVVLYGLVSGRADGSPVTAPMAFVAAGLLGALSPIVVVMSVTVLLSVYAHGLSAAPLAARYGRIVEAMHDAAPKRMPVPELPTRVSRGGG